MKSLLTSLLFTLAFANIVSAQSGATAQAASADPTAFRILDLCNTGQTREPVYGCTGQLVPPNPNGGGPNRDGNWQLAYPYPTANPLNPCRLNTFVRAWVDTPFSGWLPNSVSSQSSWITPYNGENPVTPGWYVYRTTFRVPETLPGGAVPRGVVVKGQIASDNATYLVYLESPAKSASCAPVFGPPLPVNPDEGGAFEKWTSFTFTNATPLTPGADATLYFLVSNPYYSPIGGLSASGLRVEFFNNSIFF